MTALASTIHALKTFNTVDSPTAKRYLSVAAGVHASHCFFHLTGTVQFCTCGLKRTQQQALEQLRRCWRE